MKKTFTMILAGLLALSLASCGQSAAQNSTANNSPAEQSSTEEQSAAEESMAGEEGMEKAIVGGWSIAESPEITDETRALVEKATDGMVGAKYTPVALIASQIVSGKNYCILCRIAPVTPNAEEKYALVYIYADLNGNAKITEIYDSELTASSGEGLGQMTEPESVAVTDEAKAALTKAAEKLLGAEYEPIALVGTQVVSGTNYRILCKVTAVTPSAEGEFAMVEVSEDLEGNAQVGEIYSFFSAGQE